MEGAMADKRFSGTDYQGGVGGNYSTLSNDYRSTYQSMIPQHLQG